MQSLIQQIEKGLTQPLPGIEAQYRMSHAVRQSYIQAPQDARVACVMALLYPKDNVPHIVFIERASSSNPNDKHSGQISFPGGKLEPEDASFQEGALREVNEEVGVIADDIQVIGSLSELYIPVSNFKVYPFVGYVPYTPQFIRQEAEVKSIVEVPFEYFHSSNIRKETDMTFGNNITLKRVPYFDLDGKVLWGATAMMMNELLEVIHPPVH